MKEPTDILGRMRVASPCGVSWETMEGDARARFCRLCSLNVYDISNMTRAEVEALVLKTEGRLCGRMTRRADGTVLTKDCPVGLRALRRRATRGAGAAFAALLSLFTLASGQTKKQKLSCEQGGGVKVERRVTKQGAAKPLAASVAGVVFDPFDAVIVGAEIVLTDEATEKKFSVTSTDEGRFSFAALPEGKYTLNANSPGFKSLLIEHFEVKGGEELSLKMTLAVGETEMGVMVFDSRPDYETTNGTTTIKGRMLTDFPMPRR
ncbi:MAG: carboxypeptidase-like regulatory domain-containing protein [Pyrinomonadaceae bacterium]